MKRSIHIQTILLLVLLLLGSTTISVVSARNYLLKTSSSIDLTANQTGVILLDPFGQETTVTLNIQYTYGRFARPTGFPFPNKKLPTNISIAITQQPDWCHVSLDRESFEASITTFFLRKNQTLNFSANLTLQCSSSIARAFQESIVQLNVTAEANGNIQASSDTYEIRVAPTYYLLFIADWSSPTAMLMEYGEEKNTSINVQNLGNTKTKFRIESTNLNNTFNVTFDQQPDYEEFILDIKQEKQINITIQSHTYYKQNQELILWFNITSQAEEDSSEQGRPKNFQFFIELNASSKKSDNLFDEYVQFVILLVVILTVLPLVIFYVISRRKKTKKRKTKT
jgi:hypothetical protein